MSLDNWFDRYMNTTHDKIAFAVGVILFVAGFLTGCDAFYHYHFDAHAPEIENTSPGTTRRLSLEMSNIHQESNIRQENRKSDSSLTDENNKLSPMRTLRSLTQSEHEASPLGLTRQSTL